MATRNFVNEARQYMQDVLAGTIPTCKLTRLAVQRQAKDLARAERNDPAFPYVFSEEAANRVCRFVEMHPFVDGGKDVAGKKIHLEPWQCFLLTTAFGWLQRLTGFRRFRRTYTEVAKGNGKSCLSSPLCNYTAFAEGVPGAQVYVAATTRDQAKIVFKPACQMLQSMSKYREKAGIEISGPAKDPHSLYQLSSNSFVRPLSSDADSAEGIKPIFIVVDELHAHANRDLYDNLDTANGKMRGSMLWAITTAGTNRGSVCYEQHQFIVDILEGRAVDETTFGIIYSIDPEDDPWNESTWRKANRVKQINREIENLRRLKEQYQLTGKAKLDIDNRIHALQQQRDKDINDEMMKSGKLGKIFHATLNEMITDGLQWRTKLADTFKQTVGQMNTSLAQFLVEGQGNWKQFAVGAIESIVQIGLQYAESKAMMAILDAMGLGEKKTKNAAEAQSSANTAAANTLADVPFPANIPASAAVLSIGEAFSVASMAAEQGAVLPNREALVHTHPQEMILPQHISNFIQRGAAMAMGRGGRGGGGHTFNIHLHDVTDGQGIERMVTKQVIPIIRRELSWGRA